MSQKSSQSLSRRIILLAAFFTFATVLVAVNGVVVFRARQRASNIAATPPVTVRRSLEQCARDASSWRPTQTGRLRIGAFDENTFLPIDPTQEPLDARLLQRLQEGEKAPVTLGLIWGQGTRVVWRDEAYRPCGIVQIEMGIRRATVRNVGLTLLVAMLFAGIAVFVAYALVLRPLEARIRRLRATAETLGNEVGHALAARDVTDLDAIATALEMGIAAQKEARAQLTLRAERLERHLLEVAQELRTPMDALQLVIERMVGTSSAEERRRFVSRALAEHVYLTTLLDNLELVTAIAADLPTAHVESDVELGRLLEGVVSRFSLLAEQAGIELAFSGPDEPVWLRASHTLLERGLGNIVHNAIRHGRPGGHVAVLLVSEGQRFVLTIEDDGPGMSDELLESLRQPGETALRGVARANGSRGLGLAVANVAFARAKLDVSYRRAPLGGLLVEIRGERVEVARRA